MSLVERDASLTATAIHEVSPTLTWRDGGLRRGGRPHRIIAGSVHYFRVHPELWRDRLERLAALGANTVDTYVAWNFHERRRGRIDWSGWRDIERFLEIAADVGLDAIVRPGPYICAEWDNGGLPAWLTGTPGLVARSSDPAYLGAVGEWFGALLPRLAPFQAAHGGPIVAVQLENEYGSYGDDLAHLDALRRMLDAGGVRELVYTADGPTELMQDGGSVPGVLASATFGSRPEDAAELLRRRRPGEPFFCAELWGGWFDHWGERHHVRAPEGAAAIVRDILDANGSVSLYMAHGGTNFGLWSGANHDGARLQPTVASYDSDAPIAEDGTLTPKFHAVRAVIERATGGSFPPPPADPPRLAPARLEIVRRAPLLTALRAAGTAVAAPAPPTFEALGLDAGLVLYRARPTVPAGGATLTIRGLRDRALVFVDGAHVATFDADSAAGGVRLEEAGRHELEILVENQGRINYGPLLGEGKGILGGVQLDRRLVHTWEATPLPLDTWDAAVLARLAGGEAPADLAPADPVPADPAPGSAQAGVPGPARGGGGFATAVLHVEEPADGFLAFPGFAKGFVWVNGFLLGRYWEVGPQVTSYLPAPLLHRGDNLITVLELERIGDAVELRDRAELGPPAEYVETFD